MSSRRAPSDITMAPGKCSLLTLQRECGLPLYTGVRALMNHSDNSTLIFNGQTRSEKKKNLRWKKIESEAKASRGDKQRIWTNKLDRLPPPLKREHKFTIKQWCSATRYAMEKSWLIYPREDGLIMESDIEFRQTLIKQTGKTKGKKKNSSTKWETDKCHVQPKVEESKDDNYESLFQSVNKTSAAFYSLVADGKRIFTYSFRRANETWQNIALTVQSDALLTCCQRNRALPLFHSFPGKIYKDIYKASNILLNGREWKQTFATF